ncbi:class I SAM-dependent methyltransferase [Macrococcus capreoli]|uniref:class I SAM-dependent methyltransferase n=1 Tax=Macrococcus capreoli TaxID=2982690 RepID=UPI0021D5D7E9|nr:class I SAM-dependent methyltransferase [Macrococcus sp. TMW 2.2395]MCU7557360.1 methyltransferase domain-containing protein [Macrococcus sp. TMW 2.2395]
MNHDYSKKVGLFDGTAEYYKYRFPYPDDIYTLIEKKLEYKTNIKALDLGCGDGKIGIKLSNFCHKVLLVDPDINMLKLARENSKDIDNITLIKASSNNLDSNMKDFDLITMGMSFHWMNRKEVLDKFDEILNKNGYICIINNKIISEDEYEQILNVTLKKYLGEKRRAGNGFYTHPKKDHKEVLSESVFNNYEVYKFTNKYYRTFEECLGYLYSTSYGSRKLFGKSINQFENELKNSLIKVSKNLKFSFIVETEIIIASRK